MAFVLRFVNNCKKNETKRVDHITVHEMRHATTTLIKIMQKDDFNDEIICLKNKKDINKKSKLKKLNVFLDCDGLLRVGGRLKNSNMAFDAKHQIVIPKNHAVTSLIISETHKLALHGGPKLVESIMRRKYWTIDSQSAIKKEIRQCMSCAKYTPKAMEQLMAHLPQYRVNRPLKVFMDTAIDFAGPFYTKTSTLRSSKIEKSYISVFVCMATKAMHLELVSNLTAESFIAALRRFIARRGKITNIFSDNGTNFVAANKIIQELNEDEKMRYQNSLNNEFLSNEIIWHFSPPGSPHHNGLAEAAVKSTKFHLKRALGEKHLTFEEMCTLLSQVEAVVNARPICAMSNDPNDIQPLTPAHFLNMVPMELAPENDLMDVKENYLSRWQLVQKIFQNFWIQWKNDYLNQLQLRNKWYTKNPEINVNDLVMVKDESLPASKWAMGRIVQKHPGSDGHTRVVSVKTAKNTIKRTITKVAPMPLKQVSNSLLITVLLGALSALKVAEAHNFSFFENNQKLENKQKINVEIKHSENFALITITSIFFVCFFLFLFYLMQILYKVASSQTKVNTTREEEGATNEIGANHTMIELHSNIANRSSDVHNMHTHSSLKKFGMQTESNSAFTHDAFTSCKCSSSRSNVIQSEVEHAAIRMPTPVPSVRTAYRSPLLKLEKTFHESRRESLTAIYPHAELQNLQESLK